MTFTALDLFCGAGGLSLGLQRAGLDIVLAVDSWNLSIETYSQNFDHPVLLGDLGKLTGVEILRAAGMSKGKVDLVVGGPPCQGFSIQRIGPDADVRNSLVLAYARLLKAISPRLFLMENVPGLIGKRGKVQFEAFLSEMKSAGYDTATHVINAADYGVPQIRKRVIVLGWRKGSPGFNIPRPLFSAENHLTVEQAIRDLPRPALPGTSSVDPLHRETRMSPLNRERLRFIPPGGGMEDLPVELRVECHKDGAAKIGHRNVYGRLAPDRPSGTITARFDSFTRGRFAHPHADRNITLREGARLQSFPDTFKFTGNQEDIAAQIGNAVPPKLAEALGKAAVDALSFHGKIQQERQELILLD